MFCGCIAKPQTIITITHSLRLYKALAWSNSVTINSRKTIMKNGQIVVYGLLHSHQMQFGDRHMLHSNADIFAISLEFRGFSPWIPTGVLSTESIPWQSPPGHRFTIVPFVPLRHKLPPWMYCVCEKYFPFTWGTHHVYPRDTPMK